MVFRLFIPVIVFLCLLLAPGQAIAKDPAPTTSETCRVCHQQNYLLFDTGKSHCLCSKQAKCVNCHAGTIATWDMKLAHQGLIADPLRDNRQVCQDCHPQDYQARIDQFIVMTGYTVEPAATGTPVAAVSIEQNPPAVSSLADRRTPSNYLLAAAVLLGGMLAASLYVVFCCRGESIHLAG